MKKQITFLAAVFVIATLTSFAAVRTVSNHPLGGAQYSTLLAGYNASASSGDTLIVEGTTIDYGMNDRWNKSIVVIGQGLNTQKQNFVKTRFVKADYFAGNGFVIDAGSKFYGIYFVSSAVAVEGETVFENCRFIVNPIGGGFADNSVFNNCVFESGLVITNTQTLNWLITNSVINGTVAVASGQNIIIDHCLFLSSGGCITGSGLEIKNSIFMNTSAVTGTGNNYQKNICRIPSTFPPAGNTDLGGNQSGADPLFVSYTFGTAYSTAHDYHLQLGSPAIGIATDFTDIGVHGGFTNYSSQGEPLIAPVVRSMNIQNTTAAPNGTVNVQVTATKPDDN